MNLKENLNLAGLLTLPALFLSATVSLAQADCTLPSEWFPDSIPDPQKTAMGTFTENCVFHQWSWNAFLWSMEEAGNGKLRFETFPTQEQTIDASFGTHDTTAMMTLAPRAAKADHPIDSIAQAGTLGILVAQNKRGIYYSQHVSPQMYDQIVKLDWNNAAGLTAAPDTALFDVGNIEYKAAWAIVDDTFKVPGAYVTTALIPELATVTKNGFPSVTVPENPTFVQAQVALIGFHVVGWVNGHTEAVWASFSPIGIAPVVRQGTNSGDPVSDQSTPFYAAGTTLSDCNQQNVPVQTLNDTTQDFGIVTQVCQVYDAGTAPGGNPISPDNVANINAVNASAKAEIPGTSVASGYFEVGAVWSFSDKPGVSKLNSTFQNALVGSNVLSNPVIETFTQTQNAQHNCFSCHNSLQFQPSDPKVAPLKPSMLNLSHFLMQIYVDTYNQGQ